MVTVVLVWEKVSLKRFLLLYKKQWIKLVDQ